MANDCNSNITPPCIGAHSVLRPVTIEKVFNDCVNDLNQILIIDGIDLLPDGFRVRTHDLHGLLPEIVMENSGDTFQDKERLGYRVCKLIAMVRLRERMVRFLPGCKLLPPTSIDGNAIVGLQAKPKTWIAEGRDFLAAYHDLHRQIVG
jgi:hypothetical protein